MYKNTRSIKTRVFHTGNFRLVRSMFLYFFSALLNFLTFSQWTQLIICSPGKGGGAKQIKRECAKKWDGFQFPNIPWCVSLSKPLAMKITIISFTLQSVNQASSLWQKARQISDSQRAGSHRVRQNGDVLGHTWDHRLCSTEQVMKKTSSEGSKLFLKKRIGEASAKPCGCL